MKRILQTPLRAEDLSALRIGDVFYLNGVIATSRDAAHARVVREGRRPSLDLTGGAVYHAGPIVRSLPDGRWQIVAVGPTTSMRMESLEADFLRLTGARLLIGKGGMGPATAEACRQYGAVHAVIPGGCAVTGASMIEEVVGVDWLDLGMPEAFWIARVREFGPLVVSIDCHGGNLFARRQQQIDQNRLAVAEALKGRSHL